MRRNQRKQRGIVIVAVCLFLLLLMAGLGLGVDLNRLLVAKKALQSTTEAVALAAVLELDGSANGLERARIRSGETWRRHDPPPGATMTIEFAASAAGPWLADPRSVVDLRATRVQASSKMPLTLLRGVVQDKFLPVDAGVRAQQRLVERVDSGLLPLAAKPDGRLLTGLTVASQPGAVRQTILAGVPFPVKVGDRLTLHAGEHETLSEIIRSDSDPRSGSYSEYAANAAGNGRRLVALPIVDDDLRVTGFGAFLLLPAGGTELAGGYLAGSRFRANAAGGIWQAEVVR
jgi:hypothetical protein